MLCAADAGRGRRGREQIPARLRRRLPGQCRADERVRRPQRRTGKTISTPQIIALLIPARLPDRDDRRPARNLRRRRRARLRPCHRADGPLRPPQAPAHRLRHDGRLLRRDRPGPPARPRRSFRSCSPTGSATSSPSSGRTSRSSSCQESCSPLGYAPPGTASRPASGNSASPRPPELPRPARHTAPHRRRIRPRRTAHPRPARARRPQPGGISGAAGVIAQGCSVANTWNRTQPTEKGHPLRDRHAHGIIERRGLHVRRNACGAEAAHPHAGAGWRYLQGAVIL